MIESISPDEKQVWIAFRKELEEVGISVAAFDSNKDFIIKWFARARENGSFEETTPSRASEDLGRSHTSSLDSVELDTFRSLSGQGHGVENEEDGVGNQEALDSIEGPSLPQQDISSLSSLGQPLDLLGADTQYHLRRLNEEMRELRLALKTQKDGMNAEMPFTKMRDADFWTVNEDANMRIIQGLLDRGADINSEVPAELAGNKDFAGFRPLHYAAKSGSVQGISMLLERGAHINAKTARAVTPLMVAAGGGHADAIRLLMARGADLTIRNYIGRNAFHIALFNKHLEASQISLSSGRDIDPSDSRWISRDFALHNGWKEMATDLANQGVKRSSAGRRFVGYFLG